LIRNSLAVLGNATLTNLVSLRSRHGSSVFSRETVFGCEAGSLHARIKPAGFRSVPERTLGSNCFREKPSRGAFGAQAVCSKLSASWFCAPVWPEQAGSHLAQARSAFFPSAWRNYLFITAGRNSEAHPRRAWLSMPRITPSEGGPKTDTSVTRQRHRTPLRSVP